MDTTIDITQFGAVGILLSAIGALWTWHVRTVTKKDSELIEARREHKELAEKVISVVEQNTVATIEQRDTLISNQKASEAIYKTLTEYVFNSIGEK